MERGLVVRQHRSSPQKSLSFENKIRTGTQAMAGSAGRVGQRVVDDAKWEMKKPGVRWAYVGQGVHGKGELRGRRRKGKNSMGPQGCNDEASRIGWF